MSAQLAGCVVYYILCRIAEKDVSLGKVVVLEIRIAVVCCHFILCLC